jgi:hypothetical protein
MKAPETFLIGGLMLAGYIASYAVLVHRALPRELNLCGRLEDFHIPIPAAYRYGGRWSEVAYSPLHRLDCCLRPDYWTITFIPTISPITTE